MVGSTRIREAPESSAGPDLSGADVRRLLAAGTSWLEHNAAAVNALNVFPVPDGDTGTNMMLTMRSAVEAADKAKSTDAGQVMRAAAQGAVMGARGNSGVILSQIIAGLAKGMEGAAACHGRMLAEALAEGATTAYRAVTRPVEGTILTVARATGDGALAALRGRDDASVSCLQVLERAHAAAKLAVDRTPEQLALLKQAGVVDAGGEGYRVILDGMVRMLRDGQLPEAAAMPEPAGLAGKAEMAAAVPYVDSSAIPAEEWGYCTQFVIRGEALSVEKLRDELQSIAESTLVVGDESLVRVHGHTEDPGQLLSFAVQLGRLERISIEDMDAQHDSWLKNQVEGFPTPAAGDTGEARDSESDEPVPELATVAVAPGAGLGDVFRSLGAGEIVPGGQSMNPSAHDIVEAAKRTRARTVIVLPNNGNVVTTAQHAAAAGFSEGGGPELLVVPTRTVPQGIAAQLAFTGDGNAAAAVSAMTAAAGAVRTVEITRATRSVTIEGIAVREGDALGLLDDKLVAAATSAVDAAKQALGCAEADRAELITVYRGAGVPESDAERFLQAMKELYPSAEIELVAGDQPHYDYIISVE